MKAAEGKSSHREVGDIGKFESRGNAGNSSKKEGRQKAANARPAKDPKILCGGSNDRRESLNKNRPKLSC